MKDWDANFVLVCNGKDLERDEQNLSLTYCIAIDTSDSHSGVRAASLKVEVGRCSRKRGCSCFPAVIRFCILSVLWIHSKGSRKKPISKEAKIFLPLGKRVSKDDTFLAK